MSLTPELEFFQTCGFHRIMPAIKLHYSKLFPEKIVKQFSVKFEKPPKMALFTTFSGKTLKVICQVKRPKYEKTIEHYWRNCLWTFWKSKQILIWTIRSRDIAVLKDLPNLALWPLFPNFGRTRFFPDMRFAPKCQVPSYLLFKHGLDTKSMVRFFVKYKKPSKITFFTTFSQISGKPDFSQKIQIRHFSSIMIP